MLNLGILAHVDAGKTSLTERLLHSVGVIDEIGSVDDGNTQTDSLALERQRGITIKSAVVSFAVDDVTVNLIDTPGHPDFIAEVERVLSVLDGAVLVISAVEGVQAQTRVLMRTLRRLRIPTLVFVNKIDRGGACPERVLDGVAARLTPAIVPMGEVRAQGTRGARFGLFDEARLGALLLDLLSEHDDALLAAYVEGRVSYDLIRAALVRQTGQALVHPVFFGSAVTGAGVDELIAGIKELLPRAEADVDGPVSGSVFKVERGAAGEKIAYARMFSGTLRTRDRLPLGDGQEGRVTAISVFDRGRRCANSPSPRGGSASSGVSRTSVSATPSAYRGSRPPASTTSRPRPSKPSSNPAVRPTRARCTAPSQLAEQDPDRSAPGRDAQGDLRVALRRGAEGGHPGNSGR